MYWTDLPPGPFVNPAIEGFQPVSNKEALDALNSGKPVWIKGPEPNSYTTWVQILPDGSPGQMGCNNLPYWFYTYSSAIIGSNISDFSSGV